MTKKTFDKKDIEENKYVAALSYLFLLCVIPLLLKKDSPFAQANAKQGVSLSVIWVVGMLVFWIPFFGWLLWVMLFLVNLIGLIKTLSGEYWEIPVVKDISDKINL